MISGRFPKCLVPLALLVCLLVFIHTECLFLLFPGQVVELLQRENAWSLVRSADRTVEGYIPTAYLDSVPLSKDKSCNQKELAIKAKTILQLEQSALEQSFRASDIFTKLSCKHKYSSAPSSPCTPKKGSEANNN